MAPHARRAILEVVPMSRLHAAVAIVLVGSGPALARWMPQYASQSPQVRNWFEHQHNARGQSCCLDADGHPFYGDYVINPDGSVTINLPRGARTLPAYMVLEGPNPTGHAIYWYKDYGTARIDYCFSPGTLS
jgi:hypothetical protein